MTTSRGVLGVDYVTLQGRGDRDRYNGASVEGDSYVHLGIIDPFKGSHTACDSPIKDFMLTYSDVDITCPACIEKLKAGQR